MRYGKVTVSLFTLLFAAMALFLWRLEPQREAVPVSVMLASSGGEEVIAGWKNEAGEYYLFLPGYADHTAVRLRFHAEDVRIDGRPAEDGMFCEAFELNTPYPFSYTSGSERITSALTIVQSGNLPTLYLDTNSGSMEHIHGKKGNRETGRMRLYTPEGDVVFAGNLDAINGRGNDWLVPKKSYSLQLDFGADLLGMGQAEKWILTANALDASHLRNKMIFDFADAVGLTHSPESEWVDLYLNGEYAGLYLLCERNELHEQRVAPGGEGKYLVSMDVAGRLESNNRPYVTTDSGYAFRIHDSQIGDETLQRLLQSVENAISAEDGVDPQTGKHWSELIDLDSWAKKYLIEEVFGNSDGGLISQYFYGSDAKTQMYAGPVWDYDISMGKAQASGGGGPRSIFASRPRVLSKISLSWYYELYRQEAFYERVVELYRDEYLPLLDMFLNTRMEEYTSRIAESSAMNQLRWDVLEASRTDVFTETENIHRFMQERIGFLNQLWLEEQSFCTVLIIPDAGRNTVCHMLLPGETIPSILDYEASEDVLGWYDAATDAPFDIAQPIYEDTVVYLKQLPKEEDFSVIQLVPCAAGLGLMVCMILADHMYRRAQKTKREKKIEKQKTM